MCNERGPLPNAGLRSAGVLFRCGWCGHPTDNEGNPIHTGNPGVYVDLMGVIGAKTELLNGKCCPHGNERMVKQPPSPT